LIRIDRWNDFDFLSSDYQQLYARSSATLFQHPSWLHYLYTVLAPAKRAEPVVITLVEDHDGLIGLLPLVGRRRGPTKWIEFADLGVSDYAAPVIDRDWAYELARDPSIADEVRGAIGAADLIRIDKVRSDPSELTALLGAKDTVQHPFYGHRIPLPATLEQWRDERDPAVIRHLAKLRKRIGRNQRRLEVRGLTATDEIDEAFEQLRRFRRARFADRRAIDLTEDPDCFEFYRQVAYDGARHKEPGSTWILTINDETVGVSFGLADTVTELGMLIGYDVEQWRNYSLGLVFVEALIELSIQRGKSFHDLTIGHDSYKTALGAVAEPMFSVRASRTPAGWVAKKALDQNVAARRTAKKAVAAYAERRRRAARSAARPAHTR
jgi:CelD/BcsL family acetyltransferase involved in cellulose biosynthesis